MLWRAMVNYLMSLSEWMTEKKSGMPKCQKSLRAMKRESCGESYFKDPSFPQVMLIDLFLSIIVFLWSFWDGFLIFS